MANSLNPNNEQKVSTCEEEDGSVSLTPESGLGGREPGAGND